MAKFEVNISEEILSRFDALNSLDKYAPKMIEAANPIVEDALSEELYKTHYETGEMHDSIKATKPKRSKYGGIFSTVRPTGLSFEQPRGILSEYLPGRRKTPVRNMEKFMHLELGTSKQKATPVIEKVLKKCEPEVIKKMEEVYNREIKIK